MHVHTHTSPTHPAPFSAQIENTVFHLVKPYIIIQSTRASKHRMLSTYFICIVIIILYEYMYSNNVLGSSIILRPIESPWSLHGVSMETIMSHAQQRSKHCPSNQNVSMHILWYQHRN